MPTYYVPLPCTFLQIVVYLREAYKKKKVWIFSTLGRGGQPQIHTFLKVWIFKGGWGVLGPISTLFCPILFFLRILSYFIQFLWVGRSFSGWNWRKIFSPQNVFPHFRGGRGGGPVGVKKSTLFFSFFLKAFLVYTCILPLHLQHYDRAGAQDIIVSFL